MDFRKRFPDKFSVSRTFYQKIENLKILKLWEGDWPQVLIVFAQKHNLKLLIGFLNHSECSFMKYFYSLLVFGHKTPPRTFFVKTSLCKTCQNTEKYGLEKSRTLREKLDQENSEYGHILIYEVRTVSKYVQQIRTLISFHCLFLD